MNSTRFMNLKSILTVLSLIFALSVNAQKVKLKKGIVYLDNEKFIKYEKVNSTKYFFSTMQGEEFLSVNLESFGTGKYHKYGDRSEIMHWYSVFKFLDNEEVGSSFEVDEGRIKKLVLMMYNSKIIVEGELSLDNIKLMIEKYSENVSERKFLTGN